MINKYKLVTLVAVVHLIVWPVFAARVSISLRAPDDCPLPGSSHKVKPKGSQRKRSR